RVVVVNGFELVEPPSPFPLSAQPANINIAITNALKIEMILTDICFLIIYCSFAVMEKLTIAVLPAESVATYMSVYTPTLSATNPSYADPISYRIPDAETRYTRACSSLSILSVTVALWIYTVSPTATSASGADTSITGATSSTAVIM